MPAVASQAPTKDGLGCDSSTSPPSEVSGPPLPESFKRGLCNCCPKLHGDPPPQPHEEQISPGTFRVSKTKFTDPSPFVSFHLIRLHSCFSGFLWGPKCPGLGRPSHYGSTRGVCVLRGGVMVGIAGCVYP